MTWFKIDDSFYDHPKVFDAPDCAVALWVRAGCWSARNLTDGRIPAGLPGRLCDDPIKAVSELLERGLWEDNGTGYVFRNWLEYQPSKEEVEGKREDARERMRRLRAQRSGGSSRARSPERSGEHSENFGDGSQPPTRPDQELPKGSSQGDSAAPPPPEKSKKATRIPIPFAITTEMREWATEKAPGVNLESATEEFVDYWRGVGGQRGTKLDWVATWRNRMRDKQERLPRPSNVVAIRGGNGGFDDKHAMLARARQRAAELDALDEMEGRA